MPERFCAQQLVNGKCQVQSLVELVDLAVRWMDVGFEFNCPLLGPGTIGGVPSVKVFLRDPSPYLPKFRTKPRKIANG